MGIAFPAPIPSSYSHIPNPHSRIPSPHSPIPSLHFQLPFPHFQLPFPALIPAFPAPVLAFPAPIPICPSQVFRECCHGAAREPRDGALGPGPGPLWIPLGTPRSRLEKTPGSIWLPQPGRERRIPEAPSPRAASIPNSSGIYLAAAALPPGPGFGIIPGRAERGFPGRFPQEGRRIPREKRQNSRGESGAPGTIPGSIPGRIPGWSSRAGMVLAAAELKIPGSEPGLREGTILYSQFN